MSEIFIGRTSAKLTQLKIIAFAAMGVLALSLATLLLSGCAGTGPTTDLATPTGTVSVPTRDLNTAYTVANVLQQFNTGLTASLPTVSQALTATHNTGDVGIAQDVVMGTNLVTALVTAFTNTVKASQAAGNTPAQTQVAANAALAPPNVEAITANVASTSTAGPQ